jgi:hypothetical protein
VFISADTLVPSPMSPQSLNRYAYVSGNPLKFIDPSGHAQCQTKEDCADMGTTPMGGGGKKAGGTYGVWKPPVQKTWTWPRNPVPPNWLWPNGRFNAVAYIMSEMRRNAVSTKAVEIRSLNKQPAVASRIQANLKWMEMVDYGQDWDHKAEILKLTQRRLREPEGGYWQQVGGEEYYFDTWSNIHYGYVGRASGFNSDWLLTGASVAQALHAVKSRQLPLLYPHQGNVPGLQQFDPPPDRAAVLLGVQLWNTYGASGAFPTQEQFIQALQIAPALERRPYQGGRP